MPVQNQWTSESPKRKQSPKTSRDPQRAFLSVIAAVLAVILSLSIGVYWVIQGQIRSMVATIDQQREMIKSLTEEVAKLKYGMNQSQEYLLDAFVLRCARLKGSYNPNQKTCDFPNAEPLRFQFIDFSTPTPNN